MGVLGQLSFSLRVLPEARRDWLDSLRWLGSRPPLHAAMAAYELSLLASARVPPRLKELAELKAAALVNCEFCLDVGSEFGRAEGLTEAQLRALPTFRDSEEFDQTEKLVLELAEPMTLRGPRVSRPPLSAPTDTVTCERQDKEGTLDMAGETLVTVAGNLTADPELRHTASGIPVAGFTVASTPRVFDRERNEFVDGEPLSCAGRSGARPPRTPPSRWPGVCGSSSPAASSSVPSTTRRPPPPGTSPVGGGCVFARSAMCRGPQR